MHTVKTAAAALALTLCLSGCGAAFQKTVEALPEGAQNAVTGAIRSWSDSRWRPSGRMRENKRRI